MCCPFQVPPTKPGQMHTLKTTVPLTVRPWDSPRARMDGGVSLPLAATIAAGSLASLPPLLLKVRTQAQPSAETEATV